ncbi:FAD dependent oxidoreductase [Nitzschia inconspicua]|uniref:FAD dependent oxidoreductase n=1 Tax=Nitzschia inconspicua TaxID=303405 RepID=A0A9K3KX38_9STRA|nr:FAD dependent oxidoreductase [Nitzschia inconspicua]
MGSFWLIHHHHHQQQQQQQQQKNGDNGIAIACPRGVCPGYLSPPGSPIYVATPSAAWMQIYNDTNTSRRSDLCFVGNGIHPIEFLVEDCTLVVPHFAVLQLCRHDDPLQMGNDGSGPIQTTHRSPPTVIYGKHAASVANILQRHGVNTRIVESFSEIRLYAGMKLLWASCMWLLCHDRSFNNNNKYKHEPLTVRQVHEQRQADLDRLVDELFPSLQDLVIVNTKKQQSKLLSKGTIADYMRNYSQSIPQAIPSKDLALSEFQERNGVFFNNHQTYHRQLLLQHFTVNDVDMTSNNTSSIIRTESSSKSNDDRVTVDLDRIGLKVSGTRVRNNKYTVQGPASDEKRVIIVGGGMMGSSIALALASRRPHWNITVIDESEEYDMGKTTNSSWAWLNANNKQPKSYQALNQLGIHAWKNHPSIRHLVSWLGSLVRFRDYPDFVADGGYPLEGPLTSSRIAQLEPLSNWNAEDTTTKDRGDNEGGYTFFFPDEGCVDPSAAVRTIRQEARERGVNFKCGHTVTNLIYKNEIDIILSIQNCGSDRETSTPSDQTEITADLIVSAAGCGISNKILGGIPLLHRPGRIEYAALKKTTSNQGSKKRHHLRRILVDAVRSSHVLQRSNGEIVAGGGGKLEFGGSSGSDSPGSENEGTADAPQSSDSASLLELASPLAPLAIADFESKKISHAVRPMPKDGLPVVGFQRPGLYVAVTHSGITLGPLLAEMAAAEITESVSLETLESYRPTRFATTFT